MSKRQKNTGDKVYPVIGGFHLLGASPSRLSHIAESLGTLGVEKVALCHCGGDEARELFSDYFC